MIIHVIKVGDAVAPVRERHGDFDVLFGKRLATRPVTVQLSQVHRGEALPAVARGDAVIITGSASSVTRPDPWMEPLATWVRELVDRNLPLLGVCYGHQLLAYALGGTVVTNPKGYEVGTISVTLTPEGKNDVLLNRLMGEVQSTHTDMVERLPEDAVLLVSSLRCAVQAFRVGERAYGVQFHPEFDDEVMRDYARARVELIKTDAVNRGLEPHAVYDRVLGVVRETPSAARLIERFVDIARGLNA